MKPAAGVKVIVAVSIVEAGNAPEPVDHETLPVNCGSEVITDTGVSPRTGTITPAIAELVTMIALTVTT